MGIRSALRELFRPEVTSTPAPRRRGYAGAQSNRLTLNWVAGGTSADSEIKSSSRALRQRSRQLCRDNVYAVQAQRTVVNNVIGTGVKLQAQVRKQRGGKLDDRINTAIEEAWADWCRYDSCTAAGMHCFSDVERQIMAGIFESGEVFLRVIKRPFGRSGVPFALELLEADQLDDSYDGSKTDSEHVWRMGIERDQFGRARRYAFFKQHPGDSPFPQLKNQKLHMILPADEIIHLFVCPRIGATRGVPWLAPAMQDLHHLAGFQEAQVVRARASSALMGFITSPEGELQGDAVYDEERIQEFSPGQFRYLNQGEKIEVPDLNAPNGEFDPFMRAMLRAIAAGCGISYESASKDFSASNYSSSRLSLMDDRDNYRAIQKFLKERFYQPVFEMWLEMAVLSGRVSLPTYETEPNRYRAVKWACRSWSYVDPQKEIDAMKTAVRCGFKTLRQVVQEQGGDYDELMGQRQAELALQDQYNIITDTDPSAVSNAGLTQVRPNTGDQGFPETPPSES